MPIQIPNAQINTQQQDDQYSDRVASLLTNNRRSEYILEAYIPGSNKIQRNDLNFLILGTEILSIKDQDSKYLLYFSSEEDKNKFLENHRNSLINVRIPREN